MAPRVIRLQFEGRPERLAGVVRLVHGEPVNPWHLGAEAERRLVDELAERLGPGSLLLHDRRVPVARSRIGHLAVAASGVWVIEAKAYRRLVERRDRNGWWRTGERLYVNGRDRTPLVEGLRWQLEVVRAALGSIGVPVSAALCFVDAERQRPAQGFQVDGVWVTRASELARLIGRPGPLSTADVGHIAGHLQVRLPPAAND